VKGTQRSTNQPMLGKLSSSRSEPAAERKCPIHSSRQKLWGTLDLRERWSLSWRGWSVVAGALLLVTFVSIWRAYPFLAVTNRMNTDVLVVEGWIHPYAIRAAIQEFREGSYRRVFTTGGPVQGTGGYTNDYNTSASVGAELLKKYGLANEVLQMVPSRVMDRDRTYASAIALRYWFHDHNMPVRSVNVLTEDVHARRSRLLFQEALGNDIKVGIIAVPVPDYDATHWWRYSEGVRDVFDECIAYMYAKFLFYPSLSSPDKGATQTGPTRH
jgi:uncharacterized SAM-binding protein YcdF (DUF218 family)